MTETTAAQTAKKGPRTPARRANKFANAGRAASGVTAADTQVLQQEPQPESATVAAAAVPEPVPAAPQSVATGPEEVPEGEDTHPRDSAPQNVTQPAPPPVAAPAPESEPEPEQKGPDQKEAPPPPPEGAPESGESAPGTPGIKLPDFARLQARAHTGMDPQQVALYTRSLEIQFMQVSSSYRTMLARQEALTQQVSMARDAGFPEHLLDQLAMKHNWEVPPKSE